MEIVNETRALVLADSAQWARTMGRRLVGLLGRRELPVGGGLVIEPCNSIHTFFMHFSIDVLFVDGRGIVIRQLEHMKPWRMSGVYFRARRVVELPAGTIARTRTQPGDQILFRESR